MTTSEQSPPTANYRLRGTVRAFIRNLISAAILFGLAGTFAWWQGWVFIAIGVGTTIYFLVAIKDESLYKERSEIGSNAKSWDVPVVYAWLILLLAILAVGALDVRFDWTTGFPVWLMIAGILVTVAGAAYSTWAMQVNRFFSGVVRIQTDRGHHVIDGGPYAHVRHPGYLGMLGYTVGLPLFLESWWALVPGLLALAVMLYRTAREDATLRAELPGYADYARRVRFRLIPFVW